MTAFLLSAAAVGADDKATEALVRKSNCNKCHSVDKKKIGPSYKDVAAKYKGKADAEQLLTTHLTTNPMVEIDGAKEEHEALKTKNQDEIRAVARWILSR
jgi:cytochrome c